MTFAIELDLFSVSPDQVKSRASAPGRGEAFAGRLAEAEPQRADLPVPETPIFAFGLIPLPLRADDLPGGPMVLTQSARAAPDQTARGAFSTDLQIPVDHPGDTMSALIAGPVQLGQTAAQPQANSTEPVYSSLGVTDLIVSEMIGAEALPDTAPVANEATAPSPPLPAPEKAPAGLIAALPVETRISASARPSAEPGLRQGFDARRAAPSGSVPGDIEYRAGPAQNVPASQPPVISTDQPVSGAGFPDFDIRAEMSSNAVQPQTPSIAGVAAGQTPLSVFQSALAPTHAVLVAAPAQIPDLVARAATGGADDRIIVQLDPPELGRISIDFKFDAQGLQHVTVTAETPEALRQLRAMHHELIDALQRNGLTGQDMTYKHHDPHNGRGNAAPEELVSAMLEDPGLARILNSLPDSATPLRVSAGGRLDVKL